MDSKKKFRIVVALKGGLGNQLFQYAFGVGLQAKYNCELLFDGSFFRREQIEGITTRPLELNLFENLPINFLFSPPRTTKKKLKRAIAKLFGKEYFFKVAEKNKGFDAKYTNVFENTYFSGYWQSYRYFEQVLSVLKERLKVNDASFSEGYFHYKNKINLNKNAVAIHVRRGDYISWDAAAKVFALCGQKYYLDAAATLLKKYPDLNFFVFSDDLNWCKKTLSPLKPTFVETTTAGVEDFELMRMCNHSVIANSSFSWWAAMLKHTPGQVIAPAAWYKNGEVNTDMHPPNWLEL